VSVQGVQRVPALNKMFQKLFAEVQPPPEIVDATAALGR
jgi:hypothetical protein